MKENKLPYNQKTGFKVPSGYFDSLEHRIMEKVTTSPSREEEATHLPGKSPFKVPENYFESFESRLFEKIKPETKRSKVISLFNKESLYYVAGVAAVFVAILTTFLTSQPESISWDSLDMVILEDYIHESIQYSTGDLSQVLDDGEYNFSSPPSEINEEAVLDYFNENLEEPAILFNED